MDAPAPDFFVQDETAGIYVEGSVSPRFSHMLGQYVEIDGVTDQVARESLRLGAAKLPLKTRVVTRIVEA